MSTEILNYGAHERKAILLDKLGGRDALNEALDEFYDRQLNDPRLVTFFRGTDMEILKWHQFNLMGIAFSHVPNNVDLRHLLLVRHKRLFEEQGLSEQHFDIVLEHFQKTLQDRKVEPALIQEVMDVVRPIRSIFQEGAKVAAQKKLHDSRQQKFVRRTTGAVVVLGVLATLLLRAKKRAS
jgi:hemoglobin